MLYCIKSAPERKAASGAQANVKKRGKGTMKRGKLPYRGFMLDVSRHFMPPPDVMRLIEAAALCGMNRMHWHLTDDQGWRIEIKKYPRLTEVGARRERSYFGAVSGTENNNGYYSQREIRQIVAFAAAKGIEIIPEIEIPGHAAAMLAAYPEFGCRREIVRGGRRETVDLPYERRVIRAGGIFPHLICAGKDASLLFLRDILDEVTALFPSSAVHIGGDEALKLHWRRCPDCQRRMREEGLGNEEELQRWLVLKIGEYLLQKGKDTIVYNDSLAGGLLGKHFIVQQWLGHEDRTADFIRAGGRVIVSDTAHYYFDYPYSAIDAHNIWQAPMPPAYARGYEEQVYGVECMLWTERVTNLERAAFLLFPRLPAVALKAAGEALPWEAFAERLRSMRETLRPLGLPFAPESMWLMTADGAAADRKAEQARKHSPEAGRVQEEVRLLVRQEMLEQRLSSMRLPRDLALRVMDCLWRAVPAYCGPVSSDGGDDAEAIAGRLLSAVEKQGNEA